MSIVSKITEWVTTPYTIYLVLRDPTISRSVKIRAVLVLAATFAYVVSPIDIIPDFIPFAGWLDDLIVLPVGLAVARKVIPEYDVIARKNRVQSSVKRIMFWTILSIILIVVWGLLWLGLLIYFIIRVLH